MQSLYEDKNYSYKLYKLPFTNQNLQQLIFESKIAHSKYQQKLGELNSSSTWGYTYYNIFQLTAGSKLFYNLYKDLTNCIRDYLKNESHEFLWMQSWLNFQPYEKIDELTWHKHNSYCHGYISLDPKDTITEFKNFSIKNEVGLVYIGASNYEHMVRVNTPYLGNRITLAFDVVTTTPYNQDTNLGLLPLIQ